jgi:hypothetical protein
MVNLTTASNFTEKIEELRPAKISIKDNHIEIK